MFAVWVYKKHRFVENVNIIVKNLEMTPNSNCTANSNYKPRHIESQFVYFFFKVFTWHMYYTHGLCTVIFFLKGMYRKHEMCKNKSKYVTWVER